MKKTFNNVAIIGAGTIGLSVAENLLKEVSMLGCPSELKITIIAEYFYDKTTSYGSGGLWEPYQIAGMFIKEAVV